MRLRDRLLHAVLNRLFERRDIVIDGELYLRRWYVSGRGTDTQVFLHHILKPDAGRELHDHPWDFTTKILSGGYVEEVTEFADGLATFQATNTRRAADSVTHGAEHTHRIASVEPGTFTLVTTGPARRTWGFWVTEPELWGYERATVWKSWREYLGRPPSEPDWPEDVIHP